MCVILGNMRQMPNCPGASQPSRDKVKATTDLSTRINNPVDRKARDLVNTKLLGASEIQGFSGSWDSGLAHLFTNASEESKDKNLKWKIITFAKRV